MTLSLAGAAASASFLGFVWSIGTTRLGCSFGRHIVEDDWRDTGAEPDGQDRIYIARHCARCGREVMRMTLTKQWSMGNATLYGPKP